MEIQKNKQSQSQKITMPYTRMAIPLRSIATGEGNVMLLNRKERRDEQN
jgi:hypothetical protein